MSKQSALRMLSIGGALLLTMAIAIPANAAIVDEDFNTVLGTGGGAFLTGSGFSSTDAWDDGIAGENAFGGTTLHAHVSMQAYGDTNGGVSGSGAGVLNVSGLNFNMIDEDFESVTGTGGGVFLVGDGITPDVTGGLWSTRRLVRRPRAMPWRWSRRRTEVAGRTRSSAGWLPQRCGRRGSRPGAAPCRCRSTRRRR